LFLLVFEIDYVTDYRPSLLISISSLRRRLTRSKGYGPISARHEPKFKPLKGFHRVNVFSIAIEFSPPEFEVLIFGFSLFSIFEFLDFAILDF
jgi:hypothetical protein